MIFLQKASPLFKMNFFPAFLSPNFTYFSKFLWGRRRIFVVSEKGRDTPEFQKETAPLSLRLKLPGRSLPLYKPAQKGRRGEKGMFQRPFAPLS